jgi:hypothetical protein
VCVIILSTTASAFAQQSPSDAPPTGTYVADLGFRPATDGFSFENYGDEIRVTNLTAAELRRMFGDQVCANLLGGKCALTGPAKQWMNQVNRSMADGHCEGFAALSLLMYLDNVHPTAFGASSPHALSLTASQPLQREIAYWFTTQFTFPAGPSEMFSLTPSGVVDTLAQSFRSVPRPPETYTMGIYQRDGSGGHAILPYAIEDHGDGVSWIMVYDNNFPGVERHVEVDRAHDRWRYFGSTDPSQAEALYDGDASTHNLTLAPTSTRLVKQACPFCLEDENSVVSGEQRYDELSLEGGGHAVITDAQGRRFGLVGNQLLTEIPGLAYSIPKSGTTWALDGDPVYFLPAGQTWTVTIDGTGMRKTGSSDLTLVGPGYDLSVENIAVRPGQKDTLVLSPSRNGGSIAYSTQGSLSPIITVGGQTKAADYTFTVQGEGLRGGGTIKLALDHASNQLAISTTGNQGVASYALEMVRTDAREELSYSNDGIPLRSGDTAYLNFGKFDTRADSVPLRIDRGSKGSIDETFDLTAN